MYIELIIITFCQFAIFSGLWYYYWSNLILFSIAKTSSILINLNLFCVLMSNIKLWRKFTYISHSLLLLYHNYFASSFIIWSFIHSTAHYLNIIRTNTFIELLENVGLTGNIMIILILLLIITSLQSFKNNNYSIYKLLHVTLISLISITLIIHGLFCFNNKLCLKPSTWIWLILPFLIILYETIYKYTFKINPIRTIYHNQNLLELQLPLNETYCGKTIWINCPSINIFEWHPFTVTKWNTYYDSCSIHIKIRGDWTFKLLNKLQNTKCQDLKILVDGPYYCIEKKIINTIIDNATLLVATGIGLTNFTYYLKQLAKNPKVIRSKITMIIIVKSSKEIEWLLNTLISLKDNIQFIFYFTEISDASFPFEYHLGRPHFNNILDYLLLQNRFIKANKIKIYYSGLQGVVKSITQAQKQSDIFELRNF